MTVTESKNLKVASHSEKTGYGIYCALDIIQENVHLSRKGAITKMYIEIPQPIPHLLFKIESFIARGAYSSNYMLQR